MARLQSLIIFVLSFLALQTTCHPRPAASSPVAASDPIQDGLDAGVTSIQGLESFERVAGTNLDRRNLGFRQFLDIGNGWNMYYSSWPSIALPVRKYIFRYCKPQPIGDSTSNALGTRNPYPAPK